MGTKDFWREREIIWRNEEDRCRKLFEANGKHYSYSSSEVKVLIRLKLLPERIVAIEDNDLAKHKRSDPNGCV